MLHQKSLKRICSFFLTVLVNLHHKIFFTSITGSFPKKNHLSIRKISDKSGPEKDIKNADTFFLHFSSRKSCFLKAFLVTLVV
jgi:hypothetical protein